MFKGTVSWLALLATSAGPGDVQLNGKVSSNLIAATTERNAMIRKSSFLRLLCSRNSGSSGDQADSWLDFQAESGASESCI